MFVLLRVTCLCFYCPGTIVVCHTSFCSKPKLCLNGTISDSAICFALPPCTTALLAIITTLHVILTDAGFHRPEVASCVLTQLLHDLLLTVDTSVWCYIQLIHKL